jgi:uncharacterized Zn finger protein
MGDVLDLGANSAKNAQPIQCENCGSIYMRQVLVLNKVSKLLTGSDKDSIIPIPVFRCDDCGYVNEEFRPVKING